MECPLWRPASKIRKEGPDSDMDNGRKRYPLWEATKSVSKGFGWMGALFFGMYWMGYFLTPEKQHLAEKYQVSQDAFSSPPNHVAVITKCRNDSAPGRGRYRWG